MRLCFKIFCVAPALMMLLQACGLGANEKMITAKADSLFIRVRCVKTVSELIENTLLVPAQKKLQYKIDYINETYPDTITKVQAQKIISIKSVFLSYNELIGITKELQKQSSTQLLQVSKLRAEIGKEKEENVLQYLTFENKCADTLTSALDVLVKKAIELGCKSQSFN